MYNEENYKIQSPNTGLRLLINANLSEYCGHESTKRGAGFIFQIHDINKFSNFVTQPFYYLSPGYHTEVSIRRIMFTRETEHLGKCKNKFDLYLFPFLNGENSHDFCMGQCLGEIMLKHCKCYPYLFLPFKKTFEDNSYKYNLTKNDVKFCWSITEMACQAEVKLWFQTKPTKDLCPYCEQQCIEGKYELQMTQSLLVKRKYEKYVSVSDDVFHRNYLSVHFYFDSMTILNIVESQAFTFRDMFIYIGGNLGLFLGMSFLSLFEYPLVFLELLTTIICISKNDRKINKVKKMKSENGVSLRRKNATFYPKIKPNKIRTITVQSRIG